MCRTGLAMICRLVRLPSMVVGPDRAAHKARVARKVQVARKAQVASKVRGQDHKVPGHRVQAHR